MSLQDELNELTGMLGGSDEPAPEPAPVPVEGGDSTPEPVSEPEPEPAPVETEPAEPATPEPTAVPEPAAVPEGWEAEKAQLLAQIEKLSQFAQPVQQGEPPAPTAPEPEKALFEMFSAEEILDNPQKFIEFINELTARAERNAVEKAYLRMPEVMQKVVAQQTAVKKTADEFYANNPELASVKQYVARTANELGAANPDWPMAKVLEEAAKTCYANLGIRKGLATTPAKPSAAPARTPKPGARGGGAPRLTGLAAEISELISKH